MFQKSKWATPRLRVKTWRCQMLSNLICGGGHSHNKEKAPFLAVTTPLHASTILTPQSLCS